MPIIIFTCAGCVLVVFQAGLGCSKGQGGRGGEVILFEKNPGNFRFLTLPLEIPASLLEIPQNCVTHLITPGNSTSPLIEPWNFHMLFLQYPWQFHSLNLLFRSFWNRQRSLPIFETNCCFQFQNTSLTYRLSFR